MNVKLYIVRVINAIIERIDYCRTVSMLFVCNDLLDPLQFQRAPDPLI